MVVWLEAGTEKGMAVKHSVSCSVPSGVTSGCLRGPLMVKGLRSRMVPITRKLGVLPQSTGVYVSKEEVAR